AEGKPTAEKQASSKETASKKPAKKKAAGKRSAKASKKAPVAGPQACRVCGCTEGDCSQCVEATGEPCHWVEEDLCSRCAADIKALAKPGKKAGAKKKVAKKKRAGRAAP
ncbi:MAG: hypothetical protein Q8Q29_08325, partial [Actinomycetota bacterium]|nr:hypothetical protein [Actinomycetota bacterium]